MNRVRFINESGVRICLLDFSHTHSEEALQIIESAKKLISAEPKQSVLTLTDVTETKYDKTVTQKLKELSTQNKPYVKAGAAVGVTGLKKIVFQGVMKVSGRNLSLFDTREEAIKWLSSQ